MTDVQTEEKPTLVFEDNNYVIEDLSEKAISSRSATRFGTAR